MNGSILTIINATLSTEKKYILLSPDADVKVLSLDDPPEVVPVLVGDKPAAPHGHHLQRVLLLYDLLLGQNNSLYSRQLLAGACIMHIYIHSTSKTECNIIYLYLHISINYLCPIF